MARRPPTTERIDIPAATADMIRRRCDDLIRASMYAENIIDSVALSCYHQGLLDAFQVIKHRGGAGVGRLHPAGVVHPERADHSAEKASMEVMSEHYTDVVPHTRHCVVTGIVRKCEVGGFYIVAAPSGVPVAYVANRDDAQLFAAASDLLAAAKATLEHWEITGFAKCDKDCDCIVEETRAAIAKVETGQWETGQ